MISVFIPGPAVYAEGVYEYLETFDTASNSFDLGTGWTYNAGTQNISTATANVIAKFKDPQGVLTNAENYEISAEFVFNPYDLNAIVFKADENYSNFLMFRRKSDGNTEIYRMGTNAGSLVTGAASNLRSNQVNTMKVVVKKNVYTCYMNGVEMLTYTDTAATTNYRAGIRSNVNTAKGHTVEADNFFVANLDKPVATEVLDTFENGANWSGSSYWSVANGVATTSTASAIYTFQANGGILTTPTTINDYTVSADFISVDANRQHGIVFRRSGDNYYMFRAKYQGVEFYKFTAGASAVSLGEMKVSTLSLPAGTPYNLKIVVKGNKFTGFYNGQELLTVTDSSYKSGTLGVRSNAALSVDNFYVCRGDAYLEGAVDMTDGFEDDANWSGSGWTVADGKATAADKTVNALYTFQTDGGVLTTPTAIDDYIISADFTTEDNLSLHAIAFRINGNNAYLFRAKNGYAEFFKIGNNQGKLASADSSDIVISDGGTYNLKVVVKGNTFTGYFNDIKVLSHTDTALATGKVGIRSNGVASADNFYICRGDAHSRLADIGTTEAKSISIISEEKHICAIAIDDKSTIPQLTAAPLNSSDTVEITQSTNFNEPALIKISSDEGEEEYTVYFVNKTNNALPVAQIYTGVSQVDDSIIITGKVFNIQPGAELVPIAALYSSETDRFINAVLAEECTVSEKYEITDITFPYISAEQEELTIKVFAMNKLANMKPLCKPDSVSHTQPEKTLDVPSVFSDNMVLQRNKPIKVWGKAVKGETVTVSLAEQTKSVVATNGFWELELDPVEAGGPYDLVISSQDKSVTCKDVLVGEVWICAGQSNMMWKLKNTDEAAVDIPKANYPEVRYFYQDTIRDPVPKFDVQNGEWQIITPDIAGELAALSYYFGTVLNEDLDVPVGLINVAVGATAIQAHMDEKTIASVKNYMTQPDDELETCVYNSMIKPLQPYTNAGVLWYQGEANSARNEHTTYKHLLTALIESWREQWKDEDLPFINVQLPGYSTNTIYKWPVLRQAYVDVMNSMDNVGMVVSIDTGLINDIHPTNKKPIALRLVAVAEAMVYGMDVPYMSPMYKEMSVSGDEIILTFDYADNGFKLKEGTEEILGFEICGADQLFTPADVRIVDNNKLAVRSDKVAEPVAVRYAWEQFPTVNLYNAEGFPMCPFRTDDFDPNTKKMK